MNEKFSPKKKEEKHKKAFNLRDALVASADEHAEIFIDMLGYIDNNTTRLFWRLPRELQDSILDKFNERRKSNPRYLGTYITDEIKKAREFIEMPVYGSDSKPSPKLSPQEEMRAEAEEFARRRFNQSYDKYDK